MGEKTVFFDGKEYKLSIIKKIIEDVWKCGGWVVKL